MPIRPLDETDASSGGLRLGLCRVRADRTATGSAERHGYVVQPSRLRPDIEGMIASMPICHHRKPQGCGVVVSERALAEETRGSKR